MRAEIIARTGGHCHADMLDHDYKELEIPAGPDGAFLIEKEALHIWPRGGYMLIALPNLDGSFTVTLFLPSQGEPSFQQLKDRENVTKFFQDQFPSAMEHIPELADDFFANPTGELGTIRCFPWLSDRAMLIGDAAHAIVPFHGQGMNCGFEDCAKFNQLLDHHNDDWPAACDAFQHQRKPNADAIADMAIDNYTIMRDSVSDPVFQQKKEWGFEFEKQFPKQFIPRYSMVMFHDIPYAEALKRGNIQDSILTDFLTARREDEQAAEEMAIRRIQAELSPLEFAF